MSDSTMPSLPPVLPNAEPRPSLLQNTLSTERYFLKGRHTRGENLESAVRIFFEFIRGFESLDFPGPSVTVFGSARFKEGHPLYAQARQLGTRLAQEGFSVMATASAAPFCCPMKSRTPTSTATPSLITSLCAR
jgi:hypothetical protein